MPLRCCGCRKRPGIDTEEDRGITVTGEDQKEDRAFANLLGQLGLSDGQAELVSEKLTPTSTYLNRLCGSDLSAVDLLSMVHEMLEVAAHDILPIVIRAFLEKFFRKDLHLPEALASTLSDSVRDPPWCELTIDDFEKFTNPVEVSLLAMEWVRSPACDKAMDRITESFKQYLRAIVMQLGMNEKRQRVAYGAIDTVDLNRKQVEMIVSGNTQELIDSIRGAGLDRLAAVLDELAPDLNRKIEKSVQMAMKGEAIADNLNEVLDMVSESKLGYDAVEFAAGILEEVPIAGDLVRVIKRFYSAAKGAQHNQEALKEFREDVKYVSKLLIIAIDKKMTDKLSPDTIGRATRAIEEAAEFAEALQAKGFWTRVFASGKDDRRLKEHSERLMKAVQQMQTELSFNQSSTNDTTDSQASVLSEIEQRFDEISHAQAMAAAAKKDDSNMKSIKQRLEQLQESAPDLTKFQEMVNEAVVAKQSDGVAMQSFQAELLKMCRESQQQFMNQLMETQPNHRVSIESTCACWPGVRHRGFHATRVSQAGGDSPGLRRRDGPLPAADSSRKRHTDQHRCSNDRYEDLGPLPVQGGLHTIHKARRSTGKEDAAKIFDEAGTAAFYKELSNLQELMADRGSKEYVAELIDKDETQRVLYLELADCSLDQQLDLQTNGRYTDHKIKDKISTVLKILVRSLYL